MQRIIVLVAHSISWFLAIGILIFIYFQGAAVSASSSSQSVFPPSDLTLEGVALMADEELLLTTATPGVAGAVWFSLPQYVQGGFSTDFTFRLTNFSGTCPTKTLYPGQCHLRGGDGLAMVLSGTAPGGGAETRGGVGGSGGALGFGGLVGAVVVEFDTWANGELGDPYQNHVAVFAPGPRVSVNPDHRLELGSAVDIPDIADGQNHTARVLFLPRLNDTLLADASFALSSTLATLLGVTNALVEPPLPFGQPPLAAAGRQVPAVGRDEAARNESSTGELEPSACQESGNVGSSCEGVPPGPAANGSGVLAGGGTEATTVGATPESAGEEEGMWGASSGLARWMDGDVAQLGLLLVYVDDMTRLVLTVPLSLDATLALDEGRAWVGLSAATGKAYQATAVSAWTFTEGEPRL